MIKVDDIDALLPQTQCRLCEYSGCRPYAEAIANGERIDKCLPGGVSTLQALGDLLQQDVTPLLESMQQRYKPPSVAVIREQECIGCTKCIQACPVDAIIGASKQMHTVLADICNGCELCIAPCPVDCIDLIPVPPADSNNQRSQQTLWRQRYEQRNQRLERQKQSAMEKYQENKLGATTAQSVQARKETIAAAIARAKAKKREA